MTNCAPCKVFKANIEANRNFFDKEDVVIEEIDMSDFNNERTLDLATVYGVRSAPTAVLVSKDGFSGFKTFEDLFDFIANNPIK
jgi:thioredoxin-related protein